MTDDLREQLQTTLGESYSVERELGGGGMSRVFVARETALDRQVVVKVLPSELAGQVSVDRFKREIAVAARLQHPHIVPLLTAGDSGGLPYFTMPFVKGESLRARLAKGGELPVSEAVRVLREVATALAFAHENGVVHRDIKPDNVLMSGGSAMVTDFGVAKALSASTTGAGNAITSLGVALGTPAYMAPEQASADPLVDHRADVYAWGILAYELLTGSTPFSGRPAAAMLAAQISEPVEEITRRRGTIPPALAALVTRCLEKRAADRPQTVGEIVHALDALATPSGMTAAKAAMPMAKRSSVAKLALGAAAIGLIAGIGWMFAHRAGSAALPRTIAVMPFENSSHDSAVDYLADGIGDEIHSQLTKISGLTVRGQASANSFKGRLVDYREAGSKLNVGAIVLGRMSSSAGRLHVSVDLVRTDDGSALWSDTYDSDVRNLAATRDSITHAVVNALRLTLGTAIVPRRRESPEVHDLLMRGRFAAEKLSEPDLRQALRYYEEALKIDSLDPEAWSGIGFAWTWLADGYVSPAIGYANARDAAKRAVALDDALGQAHEVLAYVYHSLDWNIPAAKKELDRALALDPQQGEAHIERGLLLASSDSIAEGVREAERAVAVDPLNPVSRAGLSLLLLANSRTRDAIDEYRRLIEANPQFFYEMSIDALGYLDLGRLDSALIAGHRDETITGSPAIFTLALTYARLGRRNDAMRVITAMEAQYKRAYIQPEALAASYAALGDLDQAFAWLDRTFESRSAYWMLYPAFSYWKPIAADPRWQRFLAKARAAQR